MIIIIMVLRMIQMMMKMETGTQITAHDVADG